MLKLSHQFLLEVVIDLTHLQGAGYIGQEIAIISALQMQFQVCKKWKNWGKVGVNWEIFYRLKSRIGPNSSSHFASKCHF